MLVGSIGTLGLVASVSFRLHPLPEVVEALALRGAGGSRVLDLLRAVRERQLEPASVTALSSGGGWDLAVLFEGFAAGVAQQRDRLALLASEAGASFELVAPEDAAAFRARHDELRSVPPLRLKLSAPPASFGGGAGKAVERLSRALSGPATVWYPTLGLAFVTGESAEPDPLRTAVEEERDSLEKTGGSLVVAAAPVGFLAGLDPWGGAKAIGLMRALKQRLDPGGSLAPGRFVGGL
jgi:glycolate oxidase FAD binding subunit